MSELREILKKVESYGYYSEEYIIKYPDRCLTVDEAIVKIKQHYLSLLPKEYTEEDFLDIFNPDRAASIGEFTYAKNGANFIKAEMAGYNLAIAKIRKKIREE